MTAVQRYAIFGSSGFVSKVLVREGISAAGEATMGKFTGSGAHTSAGS